METNKTLENLRWNRKHFVLNLNEMTRFLLNVEEHFVVINLFLLGSWSFLFCNQVIGDHLKAISFTAASEMSGSRDI